MGYFFHEDYKGARTLATFACLGETFRVVRRRLNGKRWNPQLSLLYGDIPVSNGDYLTGDPAEAATYWKERICRTYPPGSEPELQRVLAKLKAAHERGV